MSYTNSGIRVWDPLDPAEIHTASSALAQSIDTKVVGNFATTALRDTAYSGLSSASKAGIVCYITNRGGHSYWDVTSNKWQWLSVHRVLFNGNRDSAANTATSISVITMPSVTLPPGNRLIQVSASSLVTNIGATRNANTPRIQAVGTGISGGNTYAQGYLPVGSTQVSLSKMWLFTLNGTCDVDVQGVNGSGTGLDVQLSFTYSRLDILDLGPTDD